MRAVGGTAASRDGRRRGGDSGGAAGGLGSLDVQAKLIQSLGLLDLTSTDQARANGGIQTLIQLMVANFGRVEVVKAACAGLATLALRSDENRAQIQRAGGITNVVRAMKAYGASADLIKNACGVLANLAYGNSVNKVAPEACGVCVCVCVGERHAMGPECKLRPWGFELQRASI